MAQLFAHSTPWTASAILTLPSTTSLALLDMMPPEAPVAPNARQDPPPSRRLDAFPEGHFIHDGAHQIYSFIHAQGYSMLAEVADVARCWTPDGPSPCDADRVLLNNLVAYLSPSPLLAPPPGQNKLHDSFKKWITHHVIPEVAEQRKLATSEAAVAADQAKHEATIARCKDRSAKALHSALAKLTSTPEKEAFAASVRAKYFVLGLSIAFSPFVVVVVVEDNGNLHCAWSDCDRADRHYAWDWAEQCGRSARSGCSSTLLRRTSTARRTWGRSASALLSLCFSLGSASCSLTRRAWRPGSLPRPVQHQLSPLPFVAASLACRPCQRLLAGPRHHARPQHPCEAAPRLTLPTRAARLQLCPRLHVQVCQHALLRRQHALRRPAEPPSCADDTWLARSDVLVEPGFQLSRASAAARFYGRLGSTGPFTTSEDGTACREEATVRMRDYAILGLCTLAAVVTGDTLQEMIAALVTHGLARQVAVLLLNPLDTRLPCFVLGVFPQRSTACASVLKERWGLLRPLLDAVGVHLVGHGADGDAAQLRALLDRADSAALGDKAFSFHQVPS